jgi:hypothetical protein
MAKAKIIKEVEFTFSPAFEKKINGVKTVKKVKAKTKTAKTKTKKAATKTRKAKVTTKAKAVKPKVQRGYKIEKVVRELTFNKVKDFYDMWEVTGKGIEQPRYFVTEEYAQRFVDTLKGETELDKAFTNAVKRASTKTERKDLQATKELNELAGESKPIVEKGWSTYFDGPSLDIDETVKNTEDIDA